MRKRSIGWLAVGGGDHYLEGISIDGAELSLREAVHPERFACARGGGQEALAVSRRMNQRRVESMRCTVASLQVVWR